MQVVILAGGKGTRIKELSKIVPKPMIKILNKPLLLHIMNHYIRYGFKDFIIAAGYKKEVIQKYFNSLKLKNNSFFYKIDKKKCKLRIVDTGKHTLTNVYVLFSKLSQQPLNSIPETSAFNRSIK